MHPIQGEIVYLLMHTPMLSYTQLRPDGMESNKFAYHLDQLIKADYVVKNDDGYTLTPTGMSYADRVSHETMTVRLQPHIVTTIQVINEVGQAVLFKHAFQPYFGVVGYPQGRTHYGESVRQAAERELAEKSSLRNVPLTHRGIAYITGQAQGTDISRLLTHVFSGQIQGAPPLSCDDPTKGGPFWGDPNEYLDKPHMPGFVELTQQLGEEKGLFFAELSCEMPKISIA